MGILESVLIASLFTLVEIAGLFVIIAAGCYAELPAIAEWLTRPAPDLTAFPGIVFASLLAFFAFIGFEDLANVVEEAKIPHRDIPLAMAMTLIIATLLYVSVAAIAVMAVPIDQLASSSAPLSLVFRALLDINPAIINAIAVIAALNTILAQMTMAARVVHGLARQGDLPRVVGHVYPRTATPLVATGLISAATLILGLMFPLEGLAETTSIATLVVFAFVNLALLRLRVKRVRSVGPHARVPVWVPAAGLTTCIAMIAIALLR